MTESKRRPVLYGCVIRHLELEGDSPPRLGGEGTRIALLMKSSRGIPVVFQTHNARNLSSMSAELRWRVNHLVTTARKGLRLCSRLWRFQLRCWRAGATGTAR